MKGKAVRLKLSRETLRNLDDRDLGQVRGAKGTSLLLTCTVCQSYASICSDCYCPSNSNCWSACNTNCTCPV
jgi:hypothetical protein